MSTRTRTVFPLALACECGQIARTELSGAEASGFVGELRTRSLTEGSFALRIGCACGETAVMVLRADQCRRLADALASAVDGLEPVAALDVQGQG